MKSKKPTHPPDAPAHLQTAGAGFWRTTQGEFSILDGTGLRLLTLACEALDAAEAARVAIEKNGQTYTDRFGAPRTHPAVAIQRGSMITFSRLVRQLGIDLEGK